MITFISNYLKSSIRRQLILGVALVHAVIMTIFIVDLMTRQQDFIAIHERQHTVDLARALAASSTSWVMANDFIGLEEIIVSISQQKNIRYAMVLSPEGKVLGHSDREMTGKFLVDSVSLDFLKSKTHSQIIKKSKYFIDVAVPIVFGEQTIGWARISRSLDDNITMQAAIARKGGLYVVVAIFIGTLFAFFMANGLTGGLYNLLHVVKKTGGGDRDLRADMQRHDEIGHLATAFNTMLDILVEEEKKQQQSHQSLLQSNEALEQRTSQLQEVNSQLLHAEKLGAVGKLSASIAHEFNNPLFGVMSVISGIQQRVELTDDDARLLAMAINECDRMKGLIRDLQDFNRPSDKVKKPTDIHACIDSVLLFCKKELKSKNITLEKKYAHDMPLIMAVTDQMKQVVLNLLNNSAGACRKEGHIWIATEVFDEIIVLRVQDDGEGIKPEHMEHIFEPFFTTKPEVKGIGLGLSVTYGIIKAHGGKIDVASSQNQGTTFTITLPLKENVQ